MNANAIKKIFDAMINPPVGWQDELYFYNRTGQKIRYAYAPHIGENKGTVVLTHGYGENINLYHETVKEYQEAGYEVWAMDWQGHGLSDRDDPNKPLKPSARGMLRHTHDLDFFVQNLVKSSHDDNKPLIMNTHSMGGHIGLLYLKRFPGVFDAAVMSAPMFDIYRLGLGRWARPVIRGIFNLAASLGLEKHHVPANAEIWRGITSATKQLKNVITRTGKTLRNIFNDMVREAYPDAKLGRPTFGWVSEAYRTIIPSTTPEFLKSIKTPVLIGSAEFEDLVDNKAHERAAEIMPNAEHIFVKDATHGLWFQDEGPYTIWRDKVFSFIDKISADNPHEISANTEICDIADGENLCRPLRGNHAVYMNREMPPDFKALFPYDDFEREIDNDPDGPAPP